jgi:hypothetical protein
MEMSLLGTRIAGNAHALLLPGNDRFYSFNYSGLQPSCHNIVY